MNAILEQINSAGLKFVEFALPMFVQTVVLIFILLLADFVLRKKVRAVFRYWIWLLILVKLVLPTSLSSPLSLGYLFGDRLTYLDKAETPPEPQANVVETSPASVPPFIDLSDIEADRFTPPAPPIIPEVKPALTSSADMPAISVTPLSWQGAVFLTWLTVVIAMVLLLLQRAIFVNGLVAQAKEANGSIADMLKSCRSSMPVKIKLGLKISANATSPAVCGLFRPVILIPQNLASSLTADQLRAVLLHELAHIRRGDLFVNLAQTILQIIYFYNPLLWLANCIIRRIREQAVDEMVLVAMGEKAPQYPQTLVSVAKLAFKRPVLSLRLIGVVESKSALSARIKHILNRPMPKKAKLGILGLAVVIIIGAILLPMASSMSGQPKLVIKGVVKDAQTNEPIAGARVFDDGYGPEPLWEQIRPDQRSQWGAITNSAGQYSFLTWPEHHSIKIEAPGYKAKHRSLYSGHFTFNKKDQEIFDFTLEPEEVSGSSEFKTTLPNGITVELIGICEHPSEGKQWWRPDGSMLENRPYEKCNHHSGGRGSKYELAFRIINLPDPAFGWTIKSEEITGTALSEVSKDGHNVPDIRSAVVGFTEKSDKKDIGLGIAAGPWTGFGHHVTRGVTTTSDGIVFQRAIQDSQGDIVLNIIHNINQSEKSYRVIAIGKNGTEYTAHYSGGVSRPAQPTISEVVFNNLELNDVKEFLFQTRPYQWVNFKNVSLKPNFKTDVQAESLLVEIIESEKVADSSEFKAALPNGVTVELVGLCEDPTVKGQQWWRLNGKEMKEPEYDLRGKQSFKYPAFGYLLKFSPFEELHYRSQINLDHLFFSSGPVTRKGQAIIFWGEGDQQTKPLPAQDDITVDVAAGEWTENKPGRYSVYPEFTYLSDKKVVILSGLRPNPKEGMVVKTLIEATTTSTDVDIQLECITKGGKSHKSWSEGSLIQENQLIQHTFGFAVPMEDIDKIHVKHRKFYQVKFKNVSLKPNFKTDVRVELEGAKGKGGTTYNGIVSVVGIENDPVTVRKVPHLEGTPYFKKFDQKYLLAIVSKSFGQDITETVGRKSSGLSTGPGYIQKRIGFGIPFSAKGIDGLRKMRQFRRELREKIQEDIKETLGDIPDDGIPSAGGSSVLQHITYRAQSTIGTINIFFSEKDEDITQIMFVIQEVKTEKDKPDAQVESEINWVVEDYGQTRLLSDKEKPDTDNWVSVWASAVKNKGRYLVPDRGLTLKGLIKAAGYNRNKLAESYVELIRRSQQGKLPAHSNYSRNLKTLLSGEESDIVIKPHDAVAGGYIEPSANGVEFWSGYHFGEVVEMTVNDDGAKINMFADLDTGKLITPPDTLDFDDENAVLRWIKDNRIDVMRETTSSVHGLIGFNMYAARVDNYFWDADPLEFTDRLMVRIDGPVLLSVESLLPVTYLIKTSEYKMGILQILGFVENPKGIKIRYKLLNKEAAPKPDAQVGPEPVAGDWQYIGQAIPPDFNDMMILTEHIELGLIGRDAERKTFITFIRDGQEAQNRQYRFVLFNKAGNILEPDGHLVLGEGKRLEEKFTFDEPFLTRQLKGFRFQYRPLPPSGIDNISSQLQKSTHVFDFETIIPSDLAPPGRYAVELDGIDDYLLVPDSPSLRLEPPFTIEMWIKTKLPPDTSEYRGGWAVISKGFTVGTPRAYLTGFGITLDRRPKEPSELHIDFCKANHSGTYGAMYGGYPLTNGVSDWIHITHVFKGEYYKSTPGHPLVMGKFLIPTENPFKGLLGEVRLWNGARTRQELRQYKNVTLTGTEPGLAACWTFEQTEGQFARDISGNKNHARLGKFTDPDNADPKWIDLQAPSPQHDAQVEPEPVVVDWQDIGQAILPDCNDTMVLTEHISLDSIGQDVEGKVFINLFRDREKTRDQQYRFVLIKTNGTVVEPASYSHFLFGDKLWEKFNFNMPYNRNQIKEFRLQKFPQGLAQKASLPLAKPYDSHINGKMIASATSGPPGRGALHFDGKGDYLYVPDSSSLWLGPVFTVEMWIKPEFPREELENWPSWGLISKGCYTGTGRVKNRGFGATLHRFGDDPNLLMIDYSTADDNGIYSKSYGRRDFDNWIHLYHVFRPDRYKPGHGYPLVVGKFITPESPFAGRIGEIRIWRGARSREQISEYRDKPLAGDEPGLRACWTFEQTEGQIAYDISADRNHARLGKTADADEADPTWVSVANHSTLYKETVNETDDRVIAHSTIEPIGQHALSFDGVDDYLHVEADPKLTLKPPFTIEMWLKPDFSEIEGLQTSENLLPFLSLMRKGKRLFQERKIQAGGFMMFVGPSSRQDGKCYGNLYLGNADGYAYQVDLSGGDQLQPARPEWIHVSMSCTRETYIPVPDQPLMIGQNIVPSYFPFKGDIAEIRIWSGVRSGDQVARYRNKPLKGNEPGLVACWDFKRAGGQIVYDISPNGNHARLGSIESPDDADPKWVDLQAPSPQPNLKTDLQAEEAETESEYKFGPMIECVVHAIDAEADSFIDFDTGEYFSTPKKKLLMFDFDVWDRSHIVPWAKKTGADATLYYKGGPKNISWRLSCYDMATMKVQSDYWQSLRAEQIVRHLSKATHFVEDDIGMSIYPPNATHIFKTREGSMGIAQIIDYTDDPKCVKIRYKMVKKAPDRETDAGIDETIAREKVSSFIGCDLPEFAKDIKFYSEGNFGIGIALIKFDIPLPDLKALLKKSEKLPDFAVLYKDLQIKKRIEGHKTSNVDWWKPDELKGAVYGGWTKSEKASQDPNNRVWFVRSLQICSAEIKSGLMRVYIGYYDGD